MTGKISKTKKQTKATENNQRRSAQILFAIIALIVILSMVISAVSKF